MPGLGIARSQHSVVAARGRLWAVAGWSAERGIAINPRREDLLAALRGTTLPLRTLASLKAEAEAICGGPPLPAALTERPIGVVTWVDGTALDTVWQVR